MLRPARPPFVRLPPTTPARTLAQYFYVARPLVQHVIKGGRSTIFAYGQTGSSKTYTMTGVQEMAVQDLFAFLEDSPEGQGLQANVSFFEIACRRAQAANIPYTNRIYMRREASHWNRFPSETVLPSTAGAARTF